MRELVERTIDDRGLTTEQGDARSVKRVRSVTVNLAESPLSWLRARGLVDARQYEAGERLRTDYETAQLAPRITMRWEPSPVGRGRRAADAPIDPSLAQIAAKRRFDGAIIAAGPGLADIL